MILEKISNWFVKKNRCCLAPFYLLTEVLIFMLNLFKKHGLLIVTILMLLLIFFTYYSWEVRLDSLSKEELKKAADFGASYSGLATLFTGLALVLLFYTIAVQKEEMKLTRDVMNYQTVESSLFQLFGVLNNVIEEIKLVDTNASEEFKGRRVFKSYYYQLRSSFRRDVLNGSRAEIDNISISTSNIWSTFYNEERVWLPHYFRILYRIIRFIDSAKLDTNKQQDENKKHEFANLLRAQLSDYELVILFYNVHSKQGEGFKALCYRYDLLKHLPTQLLFDEAHRDDFKKERE